MADMEWDALYLGGHPGFPVTTAPLPGKLRLESDALRFVVLGEEVYEILFQISWTEVTNWDVEGTNLGSRRSTAGRAAAGALLAGFPGAIVGLAATKEEFASALALVVGGNNIGFLVRERTPTAVIAAMRTIELVEDRYREASSATAVHQQWQYQTAVLSELESCGKDGWEAVGVWVDLEDGPKVLLKRPSLE
jgi:hypothetical protein